MAPNSRHPSQQSPSTAPFCAYSDESGVFAQRFQAIAVISGAPAHLSALRDPLAAALQYHDLRELKFTQVGDGRQHNEAAQDFLREAAERAKASRIRADVIFWDSHDRRHRIVGRDDVANLGSMYYHVIEWAAKMWGHTHWHLYPDRGSRVDWEALKRYLGLTSVDRPKRGARPVSRLIEVSRGTWQLTSVQTLDSEGEPLIQLADLFAGMARFARDQAEEWGQRQRHEAGGWLAWHQDESQTDLFGEGAVRPVEMPKRQAARAHVVAGFNARCKHLRLGVSLRHRGYLWTPNPANPINFWPYEPQHEMDKAPTRSRG